MAASITRGVTFVLGGTVTAGNLDALLTAATISNLGRANVNPADDFAILVNDRQPPMLQSREPWQQVNTQVIVYTDSVGEMKPLFPGYHRVLFTDSMPAGSVISMDAAPTSTLPQVRQALVTDTYQIVGTCPYLVTAGDIGYAPLGLLVQKARVASNTVTAGDRLTMSTGNAGRLISQAAGMNSQQDVAIALTNSFEGFEVGGGFFAWALFFR